MSRPAWLLAVLVGCASPVRPPLDPQELPPPAAEPGPRAERPAGPSPIDLHAVMRLAGANSLELASVREQVEAAYAASLQANEKLWPTLSPLGEYRRHDGLTQNFEAQFFERERQSFFVGPRVQLTWTLGETYYARLAASQHWEAARFRAEATERSVVLEASVVYYDLLRETQRTRIADETLKISERLSSQLKTAFDLGRAFKGDLLRAQVQVSSNQIELARAGEAAQVAAVRLSGLLRLPRTLEIVPAEQIPVRIDFVPRGLGVEEALGRALDSRPEIKQAEADLASARSASRGVTWGPIVPELLVESQAGRLGPVLTRLDESRDASVLLGWQIGPGGLFDVGRSRLAESQARQSDIALAAARQKVIDEVRTAFAQLESSRKQISAAERSVADAEEALTLVLERFGAGATPLSEVILTEEALMKARLDRVTSVTGFNQAGLRLLAAEGAPLRAR